jgi:hypothetical protein
MDNDNFGERMQQDLSLPMLKHEAKELLMSIMMMYDVLQHQKKQPLAAQQRYFVMMMYELVISALEIFASLFNLQPSEVSDYLDKNRLFVLKHTEDKEHLQQQLLKKLYLLDAMNTITINELLDGFNDTSGNILLGTAQRIKSLIMVLELLTLRLQKNTMDIA